MNTSKKIKKPLNWSIKSINDRLAIWDYIAVKEHSPMNAALVDSRLLQAADRISSMPEIGKPYVNKQRILFVSKTGYAIIYRLTQKNVNILRISHQRRRFL